MGVSRTEVQFPRDVIGLLSTVKNVSVAPPAGQSLCVDVVPSSFQSSWEEPKRLLWILAPPSCQTVV